MEAIVKYLPFNAFVPLASAAELPIIRLGLLQCLNCSVCRLYCPILHTDSWIKCLHLRVVRDISMYSLSPWTSWVIIKNHEYVFASWVIHSHKNVVGSWNHPPGTTRNYLSYAVTFMAADAFAADGAKWNDDGIICKIGLNSEGEICNCFETRLLCQLLMTMFISNTHSYILECGMICKDDMQKHLHTSVVRQDVLRSDTFDTSLDNCVD